MKAQLARSLNTPITEFDKLFFHDLFEYIDEIKEMEANKHSSFSK